MMITNRIQRQAAPMRHRRGFTLVEIIVAGIIMSMLFGAIAVSMGQITQARNTSRNRMEAFVRADAALQAVRSDLVSVLRRQDLFQTWVLLQDDAMTIDGVEMNRDRIILFNNRLRAIRTIEYNGEGIEYESSWQLLDDDDGPVLWQRRDAMPDTYPQAGGLITPVVEGILELGIEVWDGEQWMAEWDSDFDGLPRGFRVSVTATGARPGEDPMDFPLAFLRTVVPVERCPLPLDVQDLKLAEQITIDRELPPEQATEIAEAIANGTTLPLNAQTETTEDQALPGSVPIPGGGRVTGIPEGLPVIPPRSGGGRGGPSGFGGGGGGGGGGAGGR
tara:strand:+ start:262 stop:1260 length:999 start_codon:yes stop_codon:yes gene_type:complete